ncbi:hypothetical protein ACL9RI_25430 [Janthinobacterium sp. Mn2066]|uniref:hypothetical protein n=1 Tax=Janthinobacterium sp. Mn2066 TaxID=3395264 RepID=UPI003BE67AE3
MAMAPAMTGLPPLNLNMGSSATSAAKGGDGAFGGSTRGLSGGDWNVSYGTGNISSGSVNWLYIGLAVAAVWWINKQ